MVPFIRSLSITLCAAIYPLIPKLFNIFYMLAAKPTFFQTEKIQTLINNIYVLVSVVMLFALAVKAISAIVNPDNLWDSKKGVSGVLKRSVIALVLIVAIPFMFQYFYQFQTKIVSENLIEKLILGIDIDNSSVDEDDNEDLHNLQTEYEIGNNLAAQTIQAVLHPAPDVNGNITKCVEGTNTSVKFPIGNSITVQNLLKEFVADSAGQVVNAGKDLVLGSLCTNYNQVIAGDINNLNNMVFSINETSNTWVGISKTLSNAHYVLEFEGFGLIGVVVGAIILYFLILFCIDSALRLIKLGFLEITAPMSIMAYIAGGNDVLKKWFNEVLGTLISLFLRIAAIAFLALVLEELPNFTKSLPVEYGNIIKLFLIIGSLIFVKKVPELIEKITGLKLNLAGGISGRLGQMAGVGKVAQNAWKSLGTKAGNTVKGVGATAAGFGLGAIGALGKAGINQLDNKYGDGEFLEKLRNNKAVQGLEAFGKVAKAGMSKNGKPADTIKAMKGAWEGTSISKDLSNRAETARLEAKEKSRAASMADLGCNSDGTAIDHIETDEYGNKIYKKDGNGKRIMSSDINRSIAEETVANKNYKQLGSSIIEESRMKRLKTAVDEIKSAQEKAKSVTENLQKRASDNGNTLLANRYGELMNTFNAKKFEKYINDVDSMELEGLLTYDEAKTLRFSARREEGSLYNYDTILDTYGLRGNSRLNAIANNNLGGVLLLEAATAAENLQKEATARVDKGLEGLKAGDYIYDEIQQQRDAFNAIDTQNIKDNRNRLDDSDSRYESYSNKKRYGLSDTDWAEVTDGGVTPGTQEFNDRLLQKGVNPNNLPPIVNNIFNNSNGNNNNDGVNLGGMNGGTIHVDSIQADNISANTVTGQSFRANKMSGDFNTNNVSNNVNDDRKVDETVITDERLLKELQRITQRLADLNSKASLNQTELEEINSLHQRKSQIEAAQQWQDNGSSQDDVQ